MKVKTVEKFTKSVGEKTVEGYRILKSPYLHVDYKMMIYSRKMNIMLIEYSFFCLIPFGFIYK